MQAYFTKCDGRLNFYCQKVSPDDLSKIYQAIDRYLDEVEIITKKMTNEFEIFKILSEPSVELFAPTANGMKNSFPCQEVCKQK